ncbi:hypothetical protein JDV09_12130 [Mycobacterium sp. Y57]|uniref:hypothetical protein n=1 Tax=Mycolicibacterium xanthum TaxID=2796469 RepID=UPI001C84752C|nr:hypothetical protein [Mycolicibacterium xanthum]MBX7432848.1 hypothetical protein [Mycolicibacterium xanthum]
MAEVITEYCKRCGHPKEHHDLNVHFDPEAHPAKAREQAALGQGACHDMSYGDHHCICVEYESWTATK